MGDARLQKRPENKDWETAVERTSQKPERVAQEEEGVGVTWVSIRTSTWRNCC